MSPSIAEFVGTMVLVLLGNGVVANVVLTKTKGEGSGWIVVTFGWGMAVFVAVMIAEPFSGAHINPAVTVGLAAAGQFEWTAVPAFVLAQLLGGAAGALLVWCVYHQHFDQTESGDDKLAAFCTAPALRAPGSNLFSEVIGTFVLVFTVLHMTGPVFSETQAESAQVGLGSVGALPVGLLVFSIGLSLGGTTGYAINPARDLAPRLVHACVPISGKRDSDWAYAWIPAMGPLIGGILAAMATALVG